jgi:hypothetical protein
MAKGINVLVYKYGGDQPAENHLISIATERIARTGKKGVIPTNKNVGDLVVVASPTTGDRYMLTLGQYIGVDPACPDVWQDPSSTYDRTCVEIWKPLKTAILSKDQVSDRFNNGTWNDNNKNVVDWLQYLV